VFCAIVISRILYALPAWGGFLTYELTAKIDSFLRKAVRLGLERWNDGDSVAITSVQQIYWSKLICICFIRWHQTVGIASISFFLPQKFCPWRLETHCVFALPQCHYNLYKHSFVLRNLFVSAYWLDVWWHCIFCIFYLDSLLMLCYAFNLLMAFDRLLLNGLLTYLLNVGYRQHLRS